MSRPRRLLVLNQSISPGFQHLIARLSDALGSTLLYTGMPHDVAAAALDVVHGPRYRRGRLRARAASWLSFAVGAASRLMSVGGRPLVVSATNPPILPMLTWMGSRLRGLPYVLLIWDIYPDHLVQAGLVSARNPVVRVWGWLDARALNGASAVVTVGNGMAERLRVRANGARIHVVHNWADVDSIAPLPKATNPWAREQGEVDRITVQYSGNVGATHGLDGLIEAAACLRDDPRFSFMIVGDGLDLDRLKHRGARLPNLKLLGRLPWDVLPKSLATADIAVVAQKPGSEALSVPSKTYAALAAGSAVLALTSSESDLGRLVTEENVGVVCPGRSGEEIVAGLRSMTSDVAAFAAMRARARQAAVARYSGEIAYHQWLDILRPLVEAAS